ncbi:GIY-YIG nuclease family protein [bacterium]|nr:GIY-YIG nuclease family protein [bacterium]
MPYFVYILECSDQSYYTGYTQNIKQRLVLHQKGSGSAYVYSRRPFKLIYTEEYPTQRQAMQREKEIQKWKRARKLVLIRGDLKCRGMLDD